jgi:hypothetical protein
VSGSFEAPLLARFRQVVPVERAIPAGIGRFASVLWVQARRRLSAVDPAATLIGSADAVEAGFGKVSRLVQRSLAHRGLGLTGGLLWRGLAALTGIGLAATLVSVISDTGQPSLASLTLTSAAESRPVRDVRREPYAAVADDGDWIKIARPVAMFGLESPELERQAPAYEAQRSQNGARRRDDLSFGAFDEARPHLQLRLLIEHGASQLPQPFVVAVVREAAERGMSVQRSGQAIAIATRFGPIETADATLNDGTASRACIAFRKSPGEMPLGLSGWWCGSAGRPADRQQLICLIDRIDLLSAGEDRALRTAFARSELNRQPACAAPRLAASGRKVSWLDADGRTPPLKTAVKR